jgi:trans-AT polyketide synthase, acyltransferase and oxidoreductase domains
LGIAGGLGTPTAIAAAYAQGAEYVVVGSVHQTALESGLSMQGKIMLSKMDIDDVAMAPAADMFEMGVKVQVLKKGTMMPVRANQLYELYRRYDRIEDIPLEKLNQLEKNVFRLSIDQVWNETARYFQHTDATEIEKANADPKYKMGLIFRWYIGNSSRWPLIGDETRQIDYQIWTGPALGAFNVWAKDSFLDDPKQRYVTQIALNLIEGAAKITRAQQLRATGFPVPAAAFSVRPEYKKFNLD